MENKSHIRIATRKSELALWQAKYIANLIEKTLEINSSLLPMVTEGDIKLDQSLAKIGGKGLFLKELEIALIENTADIAVHSMKDVPYAMHPELTLCAFTSGEDPRDALISNYSSIESLPQGARVGTCSQRRHCQIKKIRPDLQIKELRGNINTRLQKLFDGEYDAILLAAAGLKRLGLDHHISYYLSTEEMLPAVGQGVLGIQCRKSDLHLIEQLQCFSDQATTLTLLTERYCNSRLEGSCQSPIGLHATWESTTQMRFRALIGNLSGEVIEADLTRDIRSIEEAQAFGYCMADHMFDKGAAKYLIKT